MNSYKYLFGPVPSRRFGRSLGVDLVPRKTCTLNCVFCEVGPTTCLTLVRKEYVPVAAVEGELKDWQRLGGKADFVTITGSGEPTLHTGFGDILKFVGKTLKTKSVLLTNSTLLHLPEVRRAAVLADVVKVTLSAWDEDSFRAIARPHPDLRFAQIIEGLRLFRQEYKGAIWMEVFVVPKINSDARQIKAIAALARTIQPDRIQLNTAVRPTAEKSVDMVSADYMREISVLFEPKAELIAGFTRADSIRQCADQNVILAMVNRRPCTADDVALAFSLSIAEAKTILHRMTEDKLVRIENHHGTDYYLNFAQTKARLT